MAYMDNQRMRLTDWTPVQNDRIGLQLWPLIDDGTDTALGGRWCGLDSLNYSRPTAVMTCS
jgi:hypothetical protein